MRPIKFWNAAMLSLALLAAPALAEPGASSAAPTVSAQPDVKVINEGASSAPAESAGAVEAPTAAAAEPSPPAAAGSNGDSAARASAPLPGDPAKVEAGEDPDAKAVADEMAKSKAQEQAAAPPPPAAPTLTVSINLSSQRMTVSENGRTKYTWAISSGRQGYVTPTGTFRPLWTSKMWYSKKYDNAPMPNAIFFSGGTAIHGTYATGMLGRPASHGCVRLAPGNAATLYKLVSKHGKLATRISVHGTPPRSREPAIASRNQYRYAYGMRPPPRGTYYYQYSPPGYAAPRPPRYTYGKPRRYVSRGYYYSNFDY